MDTLDEFDKRLQELKQLGFWSTPVGMSNAKYAWLFYQIDECAPEDWTGFINQVKKMQMKQPMRPTLQEYALNLHPGDVVAISNGKFGHDLGVFKGYSISGNAQIEIPVPVSIKSYRTKPYVKTVLPNHKRRIVKVNLSDLPLEEAALLIPLSIKYKQN